MATENPYKNYQLQKEIHKKAFRYISEALQIDEDPKGDRNEALKLYKKGVLELQKGIAVKISGEGDTYEKASRLKEKMLTNQVMAEERIADLEAQKADSGTRGTSGRFHKPSIPSGKSSPKVQSKKKPESQAFPESRAKPKNHPATGKKPSLPSATSKPPSVGISGNNNHLGIRHTSTTHPSHNKPGDRNPPHSKESIASRLKNVDKKMADAILNEVIEHGQPVTFDQIAGQNMAKEALREIVILPALRPELFTGLRSPARGLLLFGPPGNGKTMLAKAVAHEANSVFFSISASSLTSKWVGESEKLVRTLFSLARELQPAIIFIDEVDSVLTERSDKENEASRRLKTEFLVQFDGVGSGEDRLLVMGATNRPQDLDQAVLRRFSKRVYVQLPDHKARVELINLLLKQQSHSFTQNDVTRLAQYTDGYSASDLTHLARDAAHAPIREMSPEAIKTIDPEKVRRLNLQDFVDSLRRIRRSVPENSLASFETWNAEFGAIA